MDPPQPHKTDGYRQLHDRYGAERLADALLAKWLSDDDAIGKWEHLGAVIALAPRTVHSPNAVLPDAPPPRPPFKYWVALWYFSMGYRVKDVAAQLEISVETVKQDLKYARNSLGLVGAPVTALVAAAIRTGIIP